MFTKFASELINEVAEECEKDINNEFLLETSARLTGILEKLVESGPDDSSSA